MIFLLLLQVVLNLNFDYLCLEGMDWGCWPCEYGCTECVSGTNCTGQCSAEGGDTLFKDNGRCKWCEPNTILHCELCSGDPIDCYGCQDHYGIDVVGEEVCFACDDPKCLTCLPNPTYCWDCVEGYGTEGSVCLPCDDDHCLKCNGGTGSCSICEEGYDVVGGNCVECNMEGCIGCSEAYVCEECEEAYFLNTVPMFPTCVPCSDPHCLNCPNTADECISTPPGCEDGWGVVNGTCAECQIENCALCNNDVDRCGLCFERYDLHITTGFECIGPCLENCLYCDAPYTCNQGGCKVEHYLGCGSDGIMIIPSFVFLSLLLYIL